MIKFNSSPEPTIGVEIELQLVDIKNLNLNNISKKVLTEVKKEFSDNIFTLNADIIDIDGLRAEYNDGWGLVRPSNTSPYIIFRFEGDTALVLKRIKSEFRSIVRLIKPTADIPF